MSFVLGAEANKRRVRTTTAFVGLTSLLPEITVRIEAPPFFLRTRIQI